MALCTLVGIDGSFSRRIGAQIAIGADGTVVGSLADGCLERQLVADATRARQEGRPLLLRYGRGSAVLDFRLPCGGGVDVLVDPAPDLAGLGTAVAALEGRAEAGIDLPLPPDAPGPLLRHRRYLPSPRVLLFGEGPEYDAFAALAGAAGLAVQGFVKQGTPGGTLALGQPPAGAVADPWTAILLLFHDHEWELALLRWALDTPAFYIGAQGGARARELRRLALLDAGTDSGELDRVRSPIGLIPRARDPDVLALSVLAEIAAAYEAMHPHQ